MKSNMSLKAVSQINVGTLEYFVPVSNKLRRNTNPSSTPMGQVDNQTGPGIKFRGRFELEVAMGFEPTYDGFAIRHAIVQVVENKVLWEQLPSALQSCLQLLAVKKTLRQVLVAWPTAPDPVKTAIRLLIERAR